MKSALTSFLVFIVLIVSGYLLINYWSYIFALEVEGTIHKVERVNSQTAILNAGPSQIQDKTLFSFAVSVRRSDGEYITSSTEDRQWAVAQPGQCVTAKFYPYPPWQLEKAGTYYNARLLRLRDCESPVAPVPTAETTKTEATSGSDTH